MNKFLLFAILIVLSLTGCLLFAFLVKIVVKAAQSAEATSDPYLILIKPKNLKFKIINDQRCVDIPAKSSLHIQCQSEHSLSWSFPQNHKEESHNIKNLATIESKCENRTGEQLCTSSFKLDSLTYEQTGEYNCFYYNNSESGEMIKHSQSIYVFVNDDNHLVVPHDGNPSIFIFLSSSTSSATVPCLPTNSNANVKLLKIVQHNEEKSNELNSAVYLPTKGFIFPNQTWTHETAFMECKVSLRNLTQSVTVSVQWTSCGDNCR
ncbi:mast/stem cell growth factor receptor kita-like protein [Leptotrombidium deliense]|uniref:Mast/stem cell growth factor receptor kita-like protein n=1 Tax=Leptotrombidium deliense TaxID=299467 RepID=A0A443S8X2_9ACAR|nr:mast/stem cell growth factor receptor kita-like protein [Leptotrombidium deliense]